MRDRELARVFLVALEESATPSGILDLQTVAKAHQVGDRFQPERVARRLADEGYLTNEGLSGRVLLAKITDAGARALKSGAVDADPRCGATSLAKD